MCLKFDFNIVLMSQQNFPNFSQSLSFKNPKMSDNEEACNSHYDKNSETIKLKI